MMHRELPLFDIPQQLKEEAIVQVRENADGDWKAEAMRAVRVVCSVQAECRRIAPWGGGGRGCGTFTTDDVWAEISPLFATHEPRAMGAIMTDAAKQGWCRKTGAMRNSRRGACHARPLAVWESRL